jgi:hypothetical protein
VVGDGGATANGSGTGHVRGRVQLHRGGTWCYRGAVREHGRLPTDCEVARRPEAWATTVRWPASQETSEASGTVAQVATSNVSVQSLLKWFYDTSTGTATRAARCGSFVGEGLGLSDVSYGGTRWRQRIYVVWAARA